MGRQPSYLIDHNEGFKAILCIKVYKDIEEPKSRRNLIDVNVSTSSNVAVWQLTAVVRAGLANHVVTSYKDHEMLLI
jgi:hypothetical protein